MINVLILNTHTDRASTLRRTHGNRLTYVEHVDLPGRPMSILMACQCPGGHGAARLPLRVWLDCSEARMDLVRAQTPIVALPAVTEPRPLAVAA